jgi:hypothetical protein
MVHPIFTKNIKITPFEADIQEKLAVASPHQNQRSKSDCLINGTCYKFNCPSINGIFRPPAAFSLVFNPRNSKLCLRLKTRSGLAGNQNLPFLDGH